MDRNRHTTALKIVALVCLVMVSVTVTIEASHFHNAYETSSGKSCPICVAAHTLTPAIVKAVFTVGPAVVLVAQKICVPESLLQQSILAFELSVRPPPSL